MKPARKIRGAAIGAVVVMVVVAPSGARGAGDAGGAGRRPVAAISGADARGPRALAVVGQAGAVGARRGTREKAGSAPDPVARLRGRIVFHRYTNYDAWDGRLYLYDFATRRLRALGDRWEIDHAINANFSPDGRQIVFMGVPRGQHRGNAWDVFLWRVDGRESPLNLTEGLGTRDEDPRFAPDGRRILFKQDGEIRIMDLASRRIRSIPFGGARAERSMPMFTRDGTHVVYAEGVRKDMDLFLVDIADGTRRPLAIEPDIQEYFPVPLDAAHFLYVRWTGPADRHDQVWVGSIDGRTRRPLPFNQPGSDSSDPCPIDDRLVVFSSTRPGGQGGYDLYLGDREDGMTWSLGALGVNSAREELGASYDRGR